jgi:pimeloyl-ACP methyl ester carboxylesterase
MPKIGSLSVQVEGKGPPLLLVHGFGISFNIWRSLLPRLSPYFTIIMPELPGIGASDLPSASAHYLQTAAQALRNLRRELGFSQWSVLGYSIGSRVVESYLNLDAEAVQRAVLLCPLKVSLLTAMAVRLALWLDSRWARTGNFLLSGSRLDFLIRLLAFNLQPHPLSAEWMREISACRPEALKRTLHSLPAGGGRPFQLPNVPALMVWGKHDWISVPPRRPGPRDRLVDSNHSAPITAAGQVADAILPFLARVE